MGARSRAIIQSTLLLFGSLVIALALCEGLARLYADFNSDQSGGTVGSAADTALLKKYFGLETLANAHRFELPLARRYLPGIAAAEGVDRRWFEQLPAMPKRDWKEVDPKASTLQDKYIRRGHFGAHSFYIWNEQFAKNTACDDHDQIFKNLPGPVKVFRPPDQSPFPRFRFPASRTLPSGLKTNRYGFRGPDFPPQRSADAIRIAFIGSSETVGQHLFPFSYPEYFGIWLDRWLAANGYPFRVEIINAGREGIGTTDVAAILKEEVLTLAPDYVIFYDGANQLLSAQSFAISSARLKHFSSKQELKSQGPFPASWAKHLLLANVANDTYNLYVSPTLDDWRRPKYEFKFPPGVDEANPSLNDPNLPLDLGVFLRDLKVMAGETRAAGIPFMISTITWLDGSELTLGTPYQTAIRAQLKSLFWPLRPPEIRRLIDFSNRTLRKFAKANGIGLLRIAKEYPHDPSLFIDGYHMTPEGLKLLAWIGLQHFLPRLAEDLHDGKLGKTRPVSVHLPMPDGDDFVPTCHPTPQAMATARAAPLSSIAIGSQGASLQPSTSGMAFRSTPQAWAYIGRMPINAECVVGSGWIAADIRVARGTAGVGVLNKEGNAFLVQRSVTPDDAKQTIFLPIDSFSHAGDFIVRNWADNSASEGVIRAVRIATESGARPPACPVAGLATLADSGLSSNSIASKIPTDAVEVHDAFDAPRIPGSNLKLGGGFPYQVRTPAQSWAYGAQFPVRVTEATGPMWIRVRARVRGGAVGIGILNQGGSDFLSRVAIEKPGDSTVILALPQSKHIGDLVVQTWAEGESADATIDAIDVFELRSTAESLPSARPLQVSGEPPPDAEEIGGAFDLPVAPGSTTNLSDKLPAELTTPAKPWAYGAQFPLRLQLKGPLWIRVRGSVRSGPLGIGILNREGTDFLARTSVGPGKMTATFEVSGTEKLGDLVIQSWAQGAPAKATIDSVAVLALPSSVESRRAEPARVSSPEPPNDAEVIHDAFGLPLKPGSKVKLHGLLPAEIDTPPQPWAYAAQFPPRDRTLVGPLWLRIQAKIKAGPVGIAVLNRSGSDFLARSQVSGTGDATITLAVTQAEQIGDLVVQSWDKGKRGDVIINSVTVMRRRSPPTAQK